MSLIDKLKHAFAIDKGDKFTEEEIALVDKLAGLVVRRQMAVPAVMFLESVRPLNFLGSQAMEFFKPIVGFVWSTAEYEKMAVILERRKSVDLIIERIEKADEEAKKPPENKGVEDNKK
ncbi:MAG: hypothetical protein WC980_09580 [Candidatus Brocadiia bacterium]